MADQLKIRPFRETDEQAVIDLWRRCDLVVPQNDPAQDVRRKLQVQRELFLVGTMAGRLVATVMAGYEGHRGWINYLAVHPELQRRGLGQVILRVAEERLRALGCPKINLQIRSANTDVIAFYRAAGYRVDDVVSMGKRLDR